MSKETVAKLEQLLHDQPENPLRQNQVEAFQEEKQRLESIVKAPSWQTGADRGAATKRFRQIDKYIREQAPKEMDASRKDSVAKLAGELLGQIRDVMLPRSVMRRNPAGAVDQFRRGEGSVGAKKAIMTWKRAMRALEPQNTDRDYTNLEKYRPEGTGEGTATFMPGAQIPGTFAMTPAAKDNWPLGEPTVVTPLKQAQAAEVAPKKPRKPMSEANKQAARERLALARQMQAEYRKMEAEGGNQAQVEATDHSS